MIKALSMCVSRRNNNITSLPHGAMLNILTSTGLNILYIRGMLVFSDSFSRRFPRAVPLSSLLWISENLVSSCLASLSFWVSSQFYFVDLFRSDQFAIIVCLENNNRTYSYLGTPHVLLKHGFDVEMDGVWQPMLLLWTSCFCTFQ